MFISASVNGDKTNTIRSSCLHVSIGSSDSDLFTPFKQFKLRTSYIDRGKALKSRYPWRYWDSKGCSECTMTDRILSSSSYPWHGTSFVDICRRLDSLLPERQIAFVSITKSLEVKSIFQKHQDKENSPHLHSNISP